MSFLYFYLVRKALHLPLPESMYIFDTDLSASTNYYLPTKYEAFVNFIRLHHFVKNGASSLFVKMKAPIFYEKSNRTFMKILK